MKTNGFFFHIGDQKKAYLLNEYFLKDYTTKLQSHHQDSDFPTWSAVVAPLAAPATIKFHAA